MHLASTVSARLPGTAPDRAALAGLAITLIFAALALASWAGWLQAAAFSGGEGQWEAASQAHWFGTNRLGQDILARAVVSTSVAFEAGLVTALAATALGALLGAVAGWYAGRWPDDLVQWLWGVLDSIPIYLLAAALAVAFAAAGSNWAMLLAMVLTFWTGTARLVRAEVLRLREREFVVAARAIGLPTPLLLVRHVLPNTGHILLVQATLTFVAAIKTEVILSFLGLGVQDGVSWGVMLAEASQDVLAGHFGNLIAATLFLSLLLIGFNLLADALQDLFDVRGIAV